MFVCWIPVTSPSDKVTWAMIPILCAKACLTGVGEETFYRGFLQPAAMDWLGSKMGIIYQAAVYASFHVASIRKEQLLAGLAFLSFVFILGLVFGAVTQRTKGIGLAATVHVTIDMAVEWGNIC